jgi:hypothetical protein
MTLFGTAQAADERVYLVALANLGGSNLAQVVFLHEPEITRLEVVRDTQISEIAEWKILFHFYQGLSIEFAKELELLVPPKFDANAISSLIA